MHCKKRSFHMVVIYQKRTLCKKPNIIIPRNDKQAEFIITKNAKHVNLIFQFHDYAVFLFDFIFQIIDPAPQCHVYPK